MKTLTKKNGSTRTYLYLVEAVRSSGKVRQKVVANLGRFEKLQEKGLDSIIEGLARYSKKQGSALRRRIRHFPAPRLEACSVFRRLW